MILLIGKFLLPIQIYYSSLYLDNEIKPVINLDKQQLYGLEQKIEPSRREAYTDPYD